MINSLGTTSYNAYFSNSIDDLAINAEQLKELENKYLGTSNIDALVEEVKEKYDVTKIRIVTPGSIITMDYWPNRLNVTVDNYDDKIILGLKMG
ncbi:MAG: hypothetical protein CMO81_06140 [Waddliaceae bacterium]|nr:hypothetical protein [Waddliaceae bacterium]